MRRVHRLIAALMLMVFIPVAVLAGPVRLCMSQDGSHAVELAHAPHDMAAGVDVAQISAAVADTHDDARPCFDRPLFAAHSLGHASSTDGKSSKLDTGFGTADLTRVAGFDPVPAPYVLSRYQYPVALLGDPQLAALRTVILLI
ncbi:MAG: hypothetical protein ACT4N2_13570 [Hyphomicrobium sp.]